MTSGSYAEGMVALSPAVNLALGGMALVLGEALVGRKLDRRWLVSMGLVGTGLAGLFTLLLWDQSRAAAWNVFNGLAIVDPLSLFVGGVIVFCAAMTLIASVDSLRRFHLDRGEFYGLILFSALGLWIMVATNNLFVMFLGLEVASISLYALAGYYRRIDRSVEASVKYLLTGAFASAILLYGFALVYLSTGSIDLPVIHQSLSQQSGTPGTLRLALVLVLVGLAFKVAAVPFHMWAPDVYEGAPTTATGFMATAVKAAGFAVLLRVLSVGFSSLFAEASSVIFWLAALTILVANLVAVVQRNLKRLMAYSSVSHAGYALIGVYALSVGDAEVAEAGMAAVVFYLPAYAAATLGVFAIISFVEEKEGRGLDLEDYAGLYRRYPVLSAALALFILSLGGIPPTAGFLAKFHLFGAAIDAGSFGDSVVPIWLAGVGILGSLIGLYYYLRLLVYVYMYEPREDDRSFRLPGAGVTTVVAVAAFLVLWLGLGPAVGFGAADILGWCRETVLQVASGSAVR